MELRSKCRLEGMGCSVIAAAAPPALKARTKASGLNSLLKNRDHAM